MTTVDISFDDARLEEGPATGEDGELLARVLPIGKLGR
jgi:hypothetical protein